MLKIFICDDEKPILRHITEQVKKQILINEYDMEVECSCESPVVLLETLRKIRERGNIYLLDVELKHPEYDGFLLGKEIRNTDPQGIIIYITSFRNLAFKTFQYHIEAFDYIVKDADKTDRSVAECLKAVTERLSGRVATIQLVTHSGAATSYIISLWMTSCILKHPADPIL